MSSTKKSLLHRPIGLSALVISFILFGLLSFQNLKVSLLPKGMRAKHISVSINWSEGSAGELIDKIVRPAEDIFRKIKGIKTINAKISKTNARFLLLLAQKEEVNEVSREITQELDDYRDRFPEDMDRPNVYFGSSEDTPILWMFFSAGDLGRDVFEQKLKDHVLPAIQKIEGVGRVDHRMEERGAISIIVNSDEAAASKAQMSKLTGHIRAAGPKNIYIDENDKGKDLLFKVRSNDLEGSNIENIPAGDTFQLGDISDVARSAYRSSYRNLVAGKPGEFIQISPTADANAYTVSKLVYEKAVELCEKYGVEQQVLVATHDLLGSAYDELLNSALIGGFGALAILLIFLRRIRLALLVTLSLPVSLGTSLIAQNLMGQDISMMTLIGYILAVGVVVDNSIVIGEALVKHARSADFFERTDKIKQVLSDLALPISVSTLTTLAIFTPLYFIDMDDNLKTIMTSIGLPILWSLIGSLVLALFLLPVIFLYIHPNGVREQKETGWNIKLVKVYERMMYWLFSHYWVSACLCLLLLLTGPFLMYQKFKKDSYNFEMNADMRIINFNVKVRKKISPELVEKDLKQWYDILEAHKEELDIKTISFSYSDWHVNAIISLNTFDKKGRLPDEIQKEIAQLLSPTENIAMAEHFYKDVTDKKGEEKNEKKGKKGGRERELSPSSKMSGMRGRPRDHKNENKVSGKKETIKLMFMGQSNNELFSNWNKLIPLLEDLEGVDKMVDNDADKGAVVLRLKNEARDLGFSMKTVAEQLKYYSWNQTLLRLENKWDVRIGTGYDELTDLSTLMAIKVINEEGVQLPLEDLTLRSSAPKETELRRRNSMNYMEFSFIVAKDLAKEIREELPSVAEAAGLRWGFDVGHHIDHRQSAKDMKSSIWILLSALLLIYLIMGILYESFFSPLAVLMTVPLTMLGVFSWLGYFDVPISVMVVLGLLFLLGIVVNNGIVLVDRLSKDMPMYHVKANQASWHILSKASSFRFMPVVLTSLTTISGGIAMISGQSKILGMNVSELGMTMTVGMITSTIFTLFVVPLIYMYIALLINFIKWFVFEKHAFIINLYRQLKFI